MPIIVQKYGGSSVADAEKIKDVAGRIAARRALGADLVVVVSAMGDTTDNLLALAAQVTESPARRELDMLLTAGERISMALLSMALHDLGVPAISFTGSQSGIITTDSHNNARILEVRPYRILDELAGGRVVIVAGYQGVSLKREVTTLGRGGSDTTAVALAAALSAEACEIYSDVDGIFTADPRVTDQARKLAEIGYEEMQALAESGARVLNAQAVEFARRAGIRIHARATRGGDGTLVGQAAEEQRVSGVAGQKDLVVLELRRAERLEELLALLGEAEVSPQEVSCGLPCGSARVLLSLENIHAFPAFRTRVEACFGEEVGFREGVGAVSVVGVGVGSDAAILRKALERASASGCEPLGWHAAGLRVLLLLPEAQVGDCTRELHAALIEEPGAPPDV